MAIGTHGCVGQTSVIKYTPQNYDSNWISQAFKGFGVHFQDLQQC